MLKSRYDFLGLGEKILGLRIIAGIMLATWLLLIIIGKGGFVHLLLLSGIGMAVVDAVRNYRSRVKIRVSELEN
ncbi:MAG: hypothetical protein ACR2LT_09835 [Pyrinomonadaceae bacterium]